MSQQARNVMVTHADQPLGRRLVKHLSHDDGVAGLLAVGSGPPPRSFDRFLRGSGGHLTYARVDLTRHRAVNELFHSGEVRQLGIDAVIHLPDHGWAGKGPRPVLAGVPDRTAEARLVLQHCLEVGPIRQLIAIGSACVYRLAPGNANRFTEFSQLDLDPDLPAALRAWVDCDMLFHTEVHNDRLQVALLRVPTVVASGGALLLNPLLESGAPAPTLRAMGFDPMCALVADKDLCRAARLALHRRAAGIFNVAGRECLPLSVLARWAGGISIPVPGPLLRGAAGAARLLGAEWLRASLDGPHLRYGFTLDTLAAERDLGFRPGYRVGLGRADDGQLQLETSQI